MNNDQQDINNTRGHPFNIGTTLQNVFRNINHAFSNNHNPSTGQQGDTGSRGRIPSTDRPLNSVGGTSDSSPAAPTPSVPAVLPLADVDVSHRSHLDSPNDEDEDSMPELQSVAYSEDESDASVAAPDPGPSQGTAITGNEGGRTSGEATSPPIAPITGTRRARVDDDGDDDRDRRHPSERVGVSHNAVPHNGEPPQQPPRLPAGLFAPLFGLGPSGGNQPAGDVPPEHVHAGETTADASPAGNNPSSGQPPRGTPVLAAGFTLTIPLFGPPLGNQPGPTPGTQAGAPGGTGAGAGAGVGPQGMFGMDAASREELLASFAAFFQEFQAAEESREDPERAKKLVGGLEAVPMGLVKRLERVGGAPGGHIGESTSEGRSGCAICWDTLLDDAEDDSFAGQHSSEDDVPPSSSSGVEEQGETHTESQAMEVDVNTLPPSDSQSTSASNGLSTEEVKIIALPCAHVFHASCLLPWFARAKQATCPTCRFNIDPENLTYTPLPRRPFNRTGPVRPDIPAPNAAPADSQATPEVPSGTLPETGDGAPAPVDTPNAGARPATTPVPPGTAPPTAGQAGAQPPGVGFNPFLVGIPILSFPAFQIPLRPPEAQTPGGGNQDGGVNVLTIGLDMFLGGPPPPQEQQGDQRDNAEAAAATNGQFDPGTAGGNGTPNPNGLAQDIQSLIEGLLRTSRNIVPQVINGQVPVPPTGGPEAPHANGVWPGPPPQARPTGEAGGPQPAPPPTGGPRTMPTFPFIPNMFRPPRPMAPRREPKTWTVPTAPGPSLRQRVEQREREQGLRCSDTSCGVGPCDDDPCPDPCASLTKQVTICPLPCDDHEKNGYGKSVCSHAFHPTCLVSAERVAGWGGRDNIMPLVEVSCPVCRAVGCVTREEWELGASEL